MVEGAFEPGAPRLVSLPVGEGWVTYCGSNLGQGARRDDAGLVELLRAAASRAGVAPTLHLSSASHGQVHLDLLEDEIGPRFLVALNRSPDDQPIRAYGQGRWHGLFTGTTWELDGDTELSLPGDLIELFVCAR